ncbi:LysR family transcriptional regulator [Noviherbaspirillum sp. L7-7A]|uniref:LysR family transcriptional regulator n=1 Tax=Noviherbaspirillum sp. L7-7A TaxID=2850560 RepID=UPI001C2C4FDD|nr:LysR family transcriptional regulator [Noviherbaspirillum sp. L7-7A]MBV0882198.1 LysR family transcriptional regulator [Noviherbaspirillum sp. L7-7A]
MNVTQRQMQAFLAIARLTSFTRAAERLHITQSGLSAMMRDLEEQLKCRLFDRTTRSVALTTEGLQLVPVASRIVAELESITDTINQISSRAQRTLRVGVTPIIAAFVMPAAITAFKRKYPDINVHIRDINREAIQNGVANGELDAGFGAFFKAQSGIERTPLAAFMLAYVSPLERKAKAHRHGTASGKTRWATLHDKPLLGLPSDNPVQELIEEQLRIIGRGDEDRPVYENFQTLLAMVEAGFGVTVLPSFIAPACQRYQVQMSLLTEPSVSLSFYEITKKGRLRPEALSALAASIRAEFESYATLSA